MFYNDFMHVWYGSTTWSINVLFHVQFCVMLDFVMINHGCIFYYSTRSVDLPISWLVNVPVHTYTYYKNKTTYWFKKI